MQLVTTDNAANYKKAGEKLVETRGGLFWTPCAAQCIDLMLEDFGKHIPSHKETIADGKTMLIPLVKELTKGRDWIRTGATRFATSYLPILDETVMAESIHGVINVPASHFLRPYTSFGILNRLQLYRIKRSMRKAAIKGKIYHLWWHPHNMGRNVDVNMKFLESIFSHI